MKSFERQFFAPVKDESARAGGGGAEKGKRISDSADFSLLYDGWLDTEEYEKACASMEEMKAILAWREQANRSPFGSFYRLVENARRIRTSPMSREEREDMTRGLSLAMEERAQRMSPRVADLYQGLLARFRGEAYDSHFGMTGEEIGKFEEDGDLDVFLSSDPGTSWELRLNRMEKRLEGYLRGARALDRRDGKEMDDDTREWRKREREKMPTTLPEDIDKSKPGVDPMERKKEGEPTTAIWKVRSAYDGYCKYFREKAFSQWDSRRNEWVGAYRYEEAGAVPSSGKKDGKDGHPDLVSVARVTTGSRERIPVPLTHGVHAVDAGKSACRIERNQDGDASVLVKGEGEEVEITVTLAPNPDKTFTSDPKMVRVPDMPSEFSDETNKELEDIRRNKRGNVERAKAIASYVRRRVRYLAPSDRAESDRYNAAYNTHPNGFAGAVDEMRAGDCDVVNTYFSAMCAKLGIPTRHVVGHSVDEDDEGNLLVHFGTGHAWTDVWDEEAREWVMMDATPAGDPNLEESKEKDRKKHRPMDLGEREAVGPSDEYLAKLKEELEKKVEELSYTPAERRIAEDTGIELREARKIVKEIEAAEETHLPDGRRIVDALAQLFDMIVESRTRFGEEYAGPLRKRDGGERIDDIVAHAIGIRSGESDPLSRSKEHEKEEEEKLIGGFDVYLVGDKSGSMSDMVDGESKWKLQRRALYLILSALHRFEEKLARSGVRAIEGKELDVRTEALSFRGGDVDDLDTDKPLSSRFESADKVRLWHGLTEQGYGNGDVVALQTIHHEIGEEIRAAEARGTKSTRLRVVIPMTDGYPDFVSGVHQMAEELGKQGAVVIGIGLTETASAVKDIYTTPWSQGDCARDINDLPALVAKYVILEAMKLFPEKVKRESRDMLESLIGSFEKV